MNKKIKIIVLTFVLVSSLFVQGCTKTSCAMQAVAGGSTYCEVASGE